MGRPTERTRCLPGTIPDAMTNLFGTPSNAYRLLGLEDVDTVTYNTLRLAMKGKPVTPRCSEDIQYYYQRWAQKHLRVPDAVVFREGGHS